MENKIKDYYFVSNDIYIPFVMEYKTIYYETVRYTSSC